MYIFLSIVFDKKKWDVNVFTCISEQKHYFVSLLLTYIENAFMNEVLNIHDKIIFV